jgi:hypothetical protein
MDNKNNVGNFSYLGSTSRGTSTTPQTGNGVNLTGFVSVNEDIVGSLLATGLNILNEVEIGKTKTITVINPDGSTSEYEVPVNSGGSGGSVDSDETGLEGADDSPDDSNESGGDIDLDRDLGTESAENDNNEGVVTPITNYHEENTLLANRGLSRDQPVIIATSDYHPVFVEEETLINFSDKNYQTTAVARLIELNRSVDDFVKKTASEVIADIMLPSIDSILNSLTIAGEQYVGLDLNSIIPFLYKELLGLDEDDNNTILVDFLSTLKVENIIEMMNELLYDVPENVKLMFQSYDSASDKSYNNFLNNIVHTLFKTKINTFSIKIAMYSATFVSDTSSLDELKKIVVGLIILANDEFLHSNELISMLEVGFLRMILKNYKDFLREVSLLESVYKKSIDFKYLKNNYNSDLNLSVLNMFSASIEKFKSATVKINAIEKLEGGDTSYSSLNAYTSYIDITPEVFSQSVLSSNNLNFASSNMQIFYSCFSKFIADTLSVDYTDENNINPSNKNDSLVFGNSGNLIKKIKKIKKLSYDNISGTFIRLDSPGVIDSLTELLALHNNSENGIINDYAEHAITRLVNNYNLSNLSQKYKNPNINTTENPEKMHDVVESLFFAEDVDIEKRIKISCELVTSLIFDYIAGSRIRQILDLDGIEGTTGTNIDNEEYEFFKNYMGNILNLGWNWKDISRKTNFKYNWDNFKNRFSDPLTSNVFFGECGNLFIRDGFDGSEKILPLETQNLIDIDPNFKLGYQEYIKNALNDNNFDFEKLSSFVNDFHTKMTNITTDLMNIFGLDYNNTGTNIYVNNSTSGGNLKGNPFGFAKDILSNMKMLISSAAPETYPTDISEGRFTSQFQSALASFFQISSGKNKSLMTQYVRAVGQNFIANHGSDPLGSYIKSMLEDDDGTLEDILNNIRYETHDPRATEDLLKDYFSTIGAAGELFNESHPLSADHHIIPDIEAAANNKPNGEIVGQDHNINLDGHGGWLFDMDHYLKGEGQGWDTNSRFYLFLYAAFKKETVKWYVDPDNKIKLDGDVNVADPYWSAFYEQPAKRLTRETPAENIIQGFWDYLDDNLGTDAKSLAGDAFSQHWENKANNYFYKKSGGPIGYNETDAIFILTTFSSIFYNYCATAYGDVRIGDDGNDPDYHIQFNSGQLDVINSILGGGNPTDEEVESTITGTVQGRVYDADFLQDIDDRTAMMTNEAIESRNRAKYIYDTLIATIHRKSLNMCNRLKGILSTIQDFHAIKEHYKYTLGGSSATNDSSLQNKGSYSTVKSLLDDYYGGINNTLLDNSIFFNKTYSRSYIISLINHLESSSNHPLFSGNRNYLNNQVKLMFKALNKENYNLHLDKKRGKQTIFTVGIPNNMIKFLRETAVEVTNDAEYENANYLIIEVFKNIAENSSFVKFYPKFFVFDISKYIIENVNKSSHIVEDSYEPDQLKNYNNQWTYDDLFNDFSFGLFNEEEKLVFKTGSELVANISGQDNKAAIRQILDNHIFDHYLKMYLTLTQGLDVSESEFPVVSSAISKLRNVDPGKEELHERFMNATLLKYPSVNVDPGLIYEFDRLSKQVKDSLFLKIKNKTNHLLTPQCFDRTFSILVNEDDFELTNDETNTSYSMETKNNIDASLEIQNNSEFAYDQNEYATKTENIHKHIINENKVMTSINQFFCVVSIAKSIPKIT